MKLKFASKLVNSKVRSKLSHIFSFDSVLFRGKVFILVSNILSSVPVISASPKCSCLFSHILEKMKEHIFSPPTLFGAQIHAHDGVFTFLCSSTPSLSIVILCRRLHFLKNLNAK